MEDKSRFFSELIYALSLMMDLDENRKLFHAWRVGILAEKLAQKILPEYRAQIFYAGLLHDIGAISLPEHVVHYTDIKEHFANPILFSHPEKSAQIVRQISPLVIAADMIMDHHEQWDGSGYPRGLAGNNINLGGQILRICDTFDILARVRPPLSLDGMKTSLSARRGVEYSDLIYELMVTTLEEGDFFNEVMDEKKISEKVLNITKELPLIDNNPNRSQADDIIRVFAKVIDAKHSYTAGHSERVAEYTYMLAKALGLKEEEAKRLKVAGYLHDAGKVAVPKSILDKPGRLTLDEFKLMKRHPVYTMEIMSMVTLLKDLVVIAGGHHERYDGAGYPDGLSGEAIPFGARIMAVADAYDAMTSVRPYQSQRSFAEAKEVIEKNSGSQFDPKVAKAAAKALP
ncbi:MAG: HD domain-containing protein [Tepidanaerobacteraceae bacterium]|jgi:HD-GYP domain-containing protein (c-di-GMP phosphodiesterase class II)|nr:HD domain-containing protein [Tepidanaerobacteraceae bacterium]